MKFSAWPSVTNPWADLVAECRHIEAAGWHGIWIGDHFMAAGEQNGGPWQEAWSVLAGLAALVPRLRLGTLVTGNTYRNPCILAKQVAQVDIISGGRVTLGMGAGWQENEHTAYGVPFFTVQERLARLAESIQIIRSLFEHERTSFDGRYYQIEDAPLMPKPVQGARLPILIGGGGEKVTLRLVARYADAWNVPGPPELLAVKGKILDEHCEREGRDPKTIWRAGAVLVAQDDAAKAGGLGRRGGFVTFGEVRQLAGLAESYSAAGAEELIVHFDPRAPLEQRQEWLSAFMADVAPQFGD